MNLEYVYIEINHRLNKKATHFPEKKQMHSVSTHSSSHSLKMICLRKIVDIFPKVILVTKIIAWPLKLYYEKTHDKGNATHQTGFSYITAFNTGCSKSYKGESGKLNVDILMKIRPLLQSPWRACYLWNKYSQWIIST